MDALSDFRIVLADDHGIVREGLKHILHEGPGLKVVGEAKNGKELLAILRERECELVISDIAMPEMDGLIALKEIRDQFPKIRVLMLSMLHDHEHFERAKTLGASGFLAKEDAADELLCAIEKIRAGKFYVSPAVISRLGEHQIQLMAHSNTPSIEVLTKRERQVLTLIAQGKTSKDMSDELKISIHTVENHRFNLSAKLGFKNIASLVRYAIEKGLA